MDVFGRAGGDVFVVKLGGAPLAEPEVLDALAADLARLRAEGVRVVVVHGGGPQLSELSDRLGLETHKVNGRRVTDAATLRLAKMVFAGEISTDIVAALRANGVSGVGLSGVDGNLIDARRRPPVRMTDRRTGESIAVDFQFVGDVRKVDTALVHTLLDGGFVPVIACLAADDNGQVFNVNADTVAAEIAVALGAARLVLMSDVPGLLRDVRDTASRVSELTLAEARGLIENGAVADGMVPKLESLIRSMEAGIAGAHIMDARAPHALIEEVRAPGTHGTFLTAEPVRIAVGERA